MARGPGAGGGVFSTPGGNRGLPAQYRPDYKIIRDIRGGINTSLPPDLIEDTETPDAQNLVYMNQALGVDFGFQALGSPLYGNPHFDVQWTSANNTVFSLIVTDKTLYAYSVSVNDWLPVPITTISNPTVSAPVVGAGSNPSVSFSGSATWATGKLVGALMDNGLYLIGPAGGTTSPVTIGTVLPVGRTILSGHTLLPLPTFTSDNSLPVSWEADPIRQTLIFTNGFDPVQEFNGTICVDLAGLVAAGITAARYIVRFYNITVLAGTTEGGTFRTFRIRRSATGDSTNWTTLNAGFDDLADTSDDITGLFLLNPVMVIARRTSLMIATYYGLGMQVFWYTYSVTGAGSFGLSSFVQTKLASIIVDVSGIFEYKGDNGLLDVGEKIFNSFLSFTGNLQPDSQDSITAFYVSILDETWILYQPTGQTTNVQNPGGYPNTILRYSHKRKAWFRRVLSQGFAMTGIGPFTTPTSKRWVDLGTIRWIDQQLPWNAAGTQAKFPSILLLGANDKQVYVYDFSASTDNGTPIAWYFVTKDYPFPENWITLDGLVFYGQGVLGLVEISTDGGKTYQTVATNLQMGTPWSRVEADYQVTSSFLRLRLSGTDPSFKLSWFAFKSMIASEH